MSKQPEKKRVMVFGVFDRLHAGHRAFLRDAACCGEVVAVIARDVMVEVFKKKIPSQNEQERMKIVAGLPGVFSVELGDRDIGSYAVIAKHRPDVICLGYDQETLAQDLAQRMAEGDISEIPLLRLAAYEPEQYHTSLLKIMV